MADNPVEWYTALGNSKTSQLNLVITGHDRSSNLNDKIGETHWVSLDASREGEKSTYGCRVIADASR